MALLLTGCSVHRPKEEPAPRLPARIVFDDPRTDSAAATATYGAFLTGASVVSEVMAAEGQGSAFSRLVEEGVELAILVPWYLLHHEFGHYRVAERQGGEPEIHLEWLTGSVAANFPSGVPRAGMDDLEFFGAGVNQSTLSARSMERSWARHGAMSPQEALGYMLVKTDLLRYTAKTLWQGTQHDVDAGRNDIVNYVRTLDRSLTEEKLLWMSVASVGFSAPFWAALGGQYRFIAEGERRVDMPTFNLNGLDCAYPTFDISLGREGPILGGRVVIGTNLMMPLDLSIDVSPSEDAMSVGLKLFDLAVAKRVRLSPFARLSSYRGGDSPGSALGVDVDVSIEDWISFGADLSYRDHDLLSQIEGLSNGARVSVWVEMLF